MNNKFLTGIFFGLLLALSAHATTCSKSYTLGFFNGVWNTEQQADKGLKALSQLIGDTYNDEPVHYESFYNHTGSSVDATPLQDLAETFIQRSAEIDASGELGRRFEYFWEFLGSSEPTFLDKLVGIFPNAASLFESLYTSITAKLTSIISYFLSHPPTEEDYAAHNTRLDALAAEGEKLMLVAHSQGNLFMNHAYDHIQPIATKDRVAAAHIAPASPTLRGDWVLADIDLVINALRIQGISSVPNNNLELNASKADYSGHTLIGAYLDTTRDGRERVQSMIKMALDNLRCRYVLVDTGFNFHTLYTDDYIFYAFFNSWCDNDSYSSFMTQGPEQFYYRFYSDGSYEYLGRSYNNNPETTAIPIAYGMPREECLQHEIENYLKQLHL